MTMILLRVDDAERRRQGGRERCGAVSALMSDWSSIFRTHSDIEASIVRGLLEANGVMSVVSSAGRRTSIFPLTVERPRRGADRRARQTTPTRRARIIDSHRTELKTGQLVRLRDEFETLQRAIGYRFRDRGLLEHAMTHTSRANEDVSGGVADNESLEFLGDAVLGFVVADMLFREFPASDEGEKSKIKASLVSTATLARQAERLALGDHLLLGRGEEKTGGRRKQALLADGYEALIAAIYLDGGIEHARAFIVREFAPLLAEVRRHGVSAAGLQVGAAGTSCRRAIARCPNTGSPAPSGPDHRKLFRGGGAWCAGEPLARGDRAEQEGSGAGSGAPRLERLRGEPEE